MRRYKTLDEGFSKWRRFLTENNAEEAGPQPMSPSEVPQEIYHATRPPLLSSIIEQGLVDYSESSRHGAGQMGVSFTTEKDLAYSGSFGNLVLVVDGAALSGSGQYEFRKVEHPDAPDEAEIRVTMTDSGSESGAGLDAAVDLLGTKIPFEPYVTKLVFPQGIKKFEAKWFKENYPNLEIEHYDREKGEIVNINDSY